jgi:cyclophilin family peptidyl-prolyl cis-trans isomerase
MNYAVFGRVVDGMDAVKQLRAGDVMNKVALVY